MVTLVAPAMSGSRSAASFAAVPRDATSIPSSAAAAVTISLKRQRPLRGQRTAGGARCASLTGSLFVVNFERFQKTGDEIVAGDSSSELHGLSCVEMARDGPEYFVGDLDGAGHGFGVLEHRTVRFVEQH